MLNGIAPLLVFTFPPAIGGKAERILQGIPVIGEELAANVGIPIPIYLDENLTGINIDTESKNIDMDTQIQARLTGAAPIVDQQGMNSTVTVDMLAKKDSIILNALLALTDMAFVNLINKEYTVSYFHKSTVIIGGLIHSLSQNQNSDSDLMTLSLTLSKANQKVVTGNEFREPIQPARVAVPLPGGS